MKNAERLSESRGPRVMTDQTIYYRTFNDGSLPQTPFAFIWMFVRRRLMGWALAVVTCAFFSMLTMGFEPPALRGLVNELSRIAGTGAWSYEATYWFIVLGGMWIISSAFNRLYQVSDIRFTPVLRYMIQAYLFSYLLEHSPRFFQENFAGKLSQKIKQAGQSAVTLLNIVLHDGVRIVTILVIGVWLLAAANPLFAVTLLAWSAVYLGLSSLLARRCMRLSQAFSEEVTTSTGRLVDAIGNVELIRSFVRSVFERNFLDVFLARERDASRRLRTFLAYSQLFQHGAMLAFQLGVLAASIAQVVRGAMTPGDFVMMVSLSTLIATQVWNLSSRLIEFFEQYGTLRNSIDLVTRPHEIVDQAEAAPLQVGRGAIEFRQIYYAHPGDRAVFEGLNLSLRGGEKVAIVGPSGAGKSTLVKLLRRQFPLDAGQILIDGRDINSVTLDSLNDAVGEVPQSPGLFHRSLRENILYARPDASQAEIEEAARKAHCHQFILQRASGYDTIVGEQGVRLSGGERQRVAIARAFLKNAPILVLDEATSSLDSETEHMIQEALFRLIAGRTVIAIAHRLSTITRMDRILYLDQGRIVEEGAHDELLRRDGVYAALWRRQVGGFLPEESALAAAK